MSDDKDNGRTLAGALDDLERFVTTTQRDLATLGEPDGINMADLAFGAEGIETFAEIACREIRRMRDSETARLEAEDAVEQRRLHIEDVAADARMNERVSHAEFLLRRATLDLGTHSHAGIPSWSRVDLLADNTALSLEEIREVLAEIDAKTGELS